MSDIFFTDPYGRQVNRPGLFTSMINSANATMDLFNKGYQNQQEAAKARYTQTTLGDSIAAANAKNQADTLYYPQQQAFQTQEDAAKIKETMALTGLSYAQAREIAARTDPTSMFESLYGKLQTLPQGSVERRYVSGLLSGMLNGSGTPVMGSSGKKSASSMFPTMGTAGGMQVSPLDTGRSGFKEALTFDENGNPITIQSPTTASGTRNQMRGEAEAESKYLSPTILNGIKPYQGFAGSLKLMSDMRNAQKNPNTSESTAAAQRVQDYLIARRLTPEAAAINARQATGQAPGIELVKHFEDTQFPALPSNFITNLAPIDLQTNASAAYTPLQQGLAEQAINQQRTGYPVSGVSPEWANANPYPNGRVDENGNYVPPQVPQPQSPLQQTFIQMPIFKSEKDFDAWFLSLPRDQQLQVRAQLTGGNK